MKLQLSTKRVADLCASSDEDLLTKTPGFATYQNEYGMYAFKDNGASILAVAHCDTVSLKSAVRVQKTKVFSPALDDRLGVYLLLDVLPSLGVKMDVLLTDSEEIGMSTARIFDAPDGRKYNWCCSFDRADGEVVMYDYEDRDSDWKSFWDKYGFKLGTGSFSDIVELEDLGCKGFNFGCGYHKQHTPDCYADLRETAKSVNKFMSFYREHHGTHFPHTKVEKWKRYSSGRGLWDDWDERHSGSPYGSRRGEYVHDEHELCSVCDIWYDVEYMIKFGSVRMCYDCYTDLCDERYDGTIDDATDKEIDDVWFKVWSGDDIGDLSPREKQIALEYVLDETG